jgi:dehydrogenase/reductase SDR family protein 12
LVVIQAGVLQLKVGEGGAIEAKPVCMPKGGKTMTKFEESTLIDRPVEAVWKYLSTIENMPKWDRGVIEARQTSEGPMGVGSTVQIVRQFLGRRRIGSFRVADVVPNRTVAIQASAKWITAQIRYTFEPVDGATRMTSAGEVELGGWLKLITPILIPMLERDGRADMANVKRLMEAPA